MRQFSGPKGNVLSQPHGPVRYRKGRTLIGELIGLAVALSGFYFGCVAFGIGVIIMLISAGLPGWRCSHCMHPVDSSHVRFCPSCKMRFD